MRVVIVGGGAMGSSLAYWLTGPMGFLGEVVVVERDPTYARASSALSASSIRQQYSTSVNIRIGQFGVEFLKGADAALAVDGEAPGIFLHENGYLFLATAAGVAVLEENHALQKAHGAEVTLLEPAALKARFPWLATEGVALASLGLAREGWFDGYGLMRAFRRRAIAQGASYRHDEVVGLDRRAERITAVRLASGETLAADSVVDCAGPWSAEVAAMAGIDLPVRPRRRCVFVVDCGAAAGLPADHRHLGLLDPPGHALLPHRHVPTGRPRPGRAAPRGRPRRVRGDRLARHRGPRPGHGAPEGQEQLGRIL